MPLHGRIVVLKRNGDDGSHYPLTSSKCVIGRALDCDIRIHLNVVSQKHCRIEVNVNNEVLLTNLSAVNPTVLNGEPMNGSRHLNDGDVFSIGGRNFRFEMVPVASYIGLGKRRSSKVSDCSDVSVQRGATDTHATIAELPSPTKQSRLTLSAADEFAFINNQASSLVDANILLQESGNANDKTHGRVNLLGIQNKSDSLIQHFGNSTPTKNLDATLPKQSSGWKSPVPLTTPDPDANDQASARTPLYSESRQVRQVQALGSQAKSAAGQAVRASPLRIVTPRDRGNATPVAKAMRSTSKLPTPLVKCSSTKKAAIVSRLASPTVASAAKRRSMSRTPTSASKLRTPVANPRTTPVDKQSARTYAITSKRCLPVKPSGLPIPAVRATSSARKPAQAPVLLARNVSATADNKRTMSRIPRYGAVVSTASNSGSRSKLNLDIPAHGKDTLQLLLEEPLSTADGLIAVSDNMENPLVVSPFVPKAPATLLSNDVTVCVAPSNTTNMTLADCDIVSSEMGPLHSPARRKRKEKSRSSQALMKNLPLKSPTRSPTGLLQLSSGTPQLTPCQPSSPTILSSKKIPEYTRRSARLSSKTLMFSASPALELPSIEQLTSPANVLAALAATKVHLVQNDILVPETVRNIDPDVAADVSESSTAVSKLGDEKTEMSSCTDDQKQLVTVLAPETPGFDLQETNGNRDILDSSAEITSLSLNMSSCNDDVPPFQRSPCTVSLATIGCITHSGVQVSPSNLPDDAVVTESNAAIVVRRSSEHCFDVTATPRGSALKRRGIDASAAKSSTVATPAKHVCFSVSPVKHTACKLTAKTTLFTPANEREDCAGIEPHYAPDLDLINSKPSTDLSTLEQRSMLTSPETEADTRTVPEEVKGEMSTSSSGPMTTSTSHWSTGASSSPGTTIPVSLEGLRTVISSAGSSSTRIRSCATPSSVATSVRQALDMSAVSASSNEVPGTALKEATFSCSAASPRLTRASSRARSSVSQVLHLELETSTDVSEADAETEPIVATPVSHSMSPFATPENSPRRQSSRLTSRSQTNGDDFHSTVSKRGRSSTSSVLSVTRNRLRKSTTTATPRLSMLRNLMKTPKSLPSDKLTDVKHLIETQAATSPQLSDERESMHDTSSLKAVSPEVCGVEKSLKEPTVELDKSIQFTGMRELMTDSSSPHFVHRKSTQLRGMRELLRSPRERKSTRLEGIRDLMQEKPRARKSVDLRGVRELVRAEKRRESTRHTGIRELMQVSPKRQSLHLVGVRDLVHESRQPRKSMQLKGVRELMQAPESEGSPPNLVGVKELLVAETAHSPSLLGVRELFAARETPNVSPSMSPSGMKLLWPTPSVGTAHSTASRVPARERKVAIVEPKLRNVTTAATVASPARITRSATQSSTVRSRLRESTTTEETIFDEDAVVVQGSHEPDVDAAVCGDSFLKRSAKRRTRAESQTTTPRKTTRKIKPVVKLSPASPACEQKPVVKPSPPKKQRVVSVKAESLLSPAMAKKKTKQSAVSRASSEESHSEQAPKTKRSGKKKRASPARRQKEHQETPSVPVKQDLQPPTSKKTVLRKVARVTKSMERSPSQTPVARERRLPRQRTEKAATVVSIEPESIKGASKSSATTREAKRGQSQPKTVAAAVENTGNDRSKRAASTKAPRNQAGEQQPSSPSPPIARRLRSRKP